ncbi:MAG: efflux RND transporter periplasmic adaptor subunit [Desulforhopalus sp.]|nr:efflux RND transporter periplasmic adaptor subunit [Desulforhopalus sp.]
MKPILILVALIVALGGGYWFGLQQTPSRAPAESGHDHAGEVAETGAKQQYTCGMHPFIIRDEPGLCPICNMELTPVKPGTTGSQPQAQTPATVKQWRSPMDPTYVRDAPGKDYMGHDLVPVTEGGGGDGAITIDPVTAQNMGVRTEPVVRRTLAKTVRTVGLMTYEEGRQFSVNSKIEGWIEKFFVNQEGQTIKKGQPLLAIYSPELVAAQQEYLLALRNSKKLSENPVPEVAESARRLLDAARTRLKYWDISDEQIAAIEKSGQTTKTLTLYSPHSGIVTVKKALEGMRVMAGEELLQISDISRIWINADIFEYELPWVKVGQTARVELPFAQGKVYTGRITYIYPYLKNETRTARARIELANPGFELKPDMYANVQIDTEGVSGALAIPSNAVLNSGAGQTVFVALEGGKFAPRPVTTGITDDNGFIHVQSGLAEGESVVVSAQFMLDSESSLREALRKMTAAPVAAPAPAPAAATAAPAPEKLDDLFK